MGDSSGCGARVPQVQGIGQEPAGVEIQIGLGVSSHFAGTSEEKGYVADGAQEHIGTVGPLLEPEPEASHVWGREGVRWRRNSLVGASEADP